MGNDDQMFSQSWKPFEKSLINPPRSMWLSTAGRSWNWVPWPFSDIWSKCLHHWSLHSWSTSPCSNGGDGADDEALFFSCSDWDLDMVMLRGRGLMMFVVILATVFDGCFLQIMWVFQKFFTSFAVLPGILPAINDHLHRQSLSLPSTYHFLKPIIIKILYIISIFGRDEMA